MKHRTLREIREAQGLTQKALAERADVAQATISHLEVGKYTPSVSTLQKVARVLGLPLDEVLGLAPSPVDQTIAPADAGGATVAEA